ncbi:MAG: hypothetical protein AB8B91_24360 [Rubripirellula sp.]
MKPRLFGELSVGDVFTKVGRTYRKEGAKTATILVDGEPTESIAFKSSSLVLQELTAQTLTQDASDRTDSRVDQVKFYSLAPGDVFMHDGHLYLKEDFRSASLMRWSSGETPAKKSIHTFHPETVVEVVGEDAD